MEESQIVAAYMFDSSWSIVFSWEVTLLFNSRENSMLSFHRKLNHTHITDVTDAKKDTTLSIQMWNAVISCVQHSTCNSNVAHNARSRADDTARANVCIIVYDNENFVWRFYFILMAPIDDIKCRARQFNGQTCAQQHQWRISTHLLHLLACNKDSNTENWKSPCQIAETNESNGRPCGKTIYRNFAQKIHLCGYGQNH